MPLPVGTWNLQGHPSLANSTLPVSVHVLHLSLLCAKLQVLSAIDKRHRYQRALRRQLPGLPLPEDVTA